MRIAIAGCGAAGHSAAKRLKESSPDSKVILFDQEGHGLYTKIRLPEFLAGKLPKEKLTLSSPDAILKLGVDARFGESVASVSPSERTLRTSKGETLEYDSLVIATGAKAFKPLPEGCHPELIHTLRTLEDADRLCSLAGSSKSAIVVGGGLLGLEAAWALSSKGLSIQIVECLPRLLPKQLDEDEASLLKSKIAEMGFKLHLGCAVVCANMDGGKVSLRLDSGAVLSSDIMLASAGIVPETSLAKAAGLETGRGIRVNDRLESSAPGIYAAGDCAEIGGRVWGLWAAAKDQGEAVADIILGARDSFSSPVYEPSLKVSGIQLKQIRQEAAMLKKGRSR